MAGYIGNIPTPQATQTRDAFVATQGQTSFPTSGYSPGYLDVYLNGIHLDPADYTATNGSDVVLNVAADSDDIVNIVAWSIFEIAKLSNTFEVYKFTATNNQTVFTGADDSSATLSISSAGNEIVTLNGIVLKEGTDYTATSSTVTLTNGAILNDELNVYSFGTFEVADTVSASTGGTFNGGVTFDGNATFNGTVTGISTGAGYFLGENGATGDTTNGLGDIFRVHEDTLDTAVTIAANTNASATGPLTLNAAVTVNGTLTIV